MSALTTEQMLKEIYDRVNALEQPLTEAEIKRLISEQLDAFLQDETFQRKMRFGGPGQQPEARLFGSKFARWRLSLADIEFLYDLQTALHQFNPARYIGPSEVLRNAFESISEAYYVPQEKIREIDRDALDKVFPRVPASAFYGRDQQLAKRGAWEETEAYQRAIRAMDTAESGFGSQLVGAQYVGDLWDGASMESRIFALLNTFEMTAPTAYLPVAADIPEMLFVSESTANNSSNYNTSKTGSNRVQVDAKKFVIHQMWSGEMEEDSIIPFIPFLRMQAEMSVSHYSDSVVLNGDTTNAGTGNINLDDADPADTKHYLAFDGIRHVGLVDNTANQKDLAGPITWAALVAARSRMLQTAYLLDWGHPTNLQDLVQICDPETGDKIVQLDEVVQWNIQQGRPLLPGQIAEILGNAVISSAAQSKTEADGKVSTTTNNNTKGQVTTFNRRGFVAGWRRRVKTMVEQLPATDQVRIVYSLRLGFGRFTPTGAASGIEAADVIYDIDLS